MDHRSRANLAIADNSVRTNEDAFPDQRLVIDDGGGMDPLNSRWRKEDTNDAGEGGPGFVNHNQSLAGEACPQWVSAAQNHGRLGCTQEFRGVVSPWFAKGD
jgi:hypothetical protein